MKRILVVPIWWRRLGSISEVEIDLTVYDETFNVEVDPWAKNSPSWVWSFQGVKTTWRKRRYRQLIKAARDVAAQAAISGEGKLTLLPSVRMIRSAEWREIVFSDLALKQLEFVRATCTTNMFDKRRVRLEASALELTELVNDLDDPDKSYADMLEQFGRWRLQVKLCGVCHRFHAPQDYCGAFTGGQVETSTDTSG